MNFGRGNTKASVDVPFLVMVIALSLFGVLMVYNSSVALAIRDFSDPLYYVKEQVKWLVLGFMSLYVCSLVRYTLWREIAVPMLLITLALLFAVFLPGIGVSALGAHRWIRLGFTVFQPAELAKLSLIFYLSAWFTSRENSRLTSFLTLLGLVVGLVVLEPDLGTAMIITSVGVCMYFLSGSPLKHFAILVPSLIAGILILAVISPYRFERLTSFLHPEKDPLGSSYQMRQSLIAFGSGGLTGIGLGKSRQKYEYLPEANTDSIFAIIGEELGFIGTSSVVCFYLLLLWRAFALARRAPDAFSRLVAVGIASWIGIQTSLNFSALVALVPLTGIPLPLVSYGGSSLIVLLSGIGILLNISRYRKI
ncbi:putative lipid II flippase FtsW [Candidatus Gottesmanbacteria bacterium]|nr:putative lipid II flippase FtsW [Candidatus Gottesmanbacteria bacterium]